MGYRPIVISPSVIVPFKKFFKEKFRVYDTPAVIIENYKGQVGIDEKAYIPASVFDNQNMSLKKITELANALDTNIKN